MKITIKEYLRLLTIILVVNFVVTYGWQWLEVIYYGEVQIREVDNIIGTILILSILTNIAFIEALRIGIKRLNEEV